MFEELFGDHINELINVLNNSEDEYFNGITEEQLTEIFSQLINHEDVDEIIDEITNELRENKYTKEDVKTFSNAFSDYLNSIKTSYQNNNAIKKSLFDKAINLIYEVMSAGLAEYKAYDVKIKIKKFIESAKLPKYAYDEDMGADVYAIQNQVLPPHSFGNKIPLGFAMELPNGWGIAVRPRSGLSAKTKIRISNTPGTIENNYRGEVCVLIDNFSDEDFVINQGDKIAQFILEKKYYGEYVFSDELSETDRGQGGFGSTDK